MLKGIPSKGKSMHPLFLHGDRLIVEKIKKVHTNNIVVARTGKELFAHRVIYTDTDENFFVTRGDANNKSDRKMTDVDILGKVEKIRRQRRIIRVEHLYLAQSSIYLSTLSEIIKAFAENKIRYVFLKGLPVNIFIDSAPPQRLYLDADILVGRRNFEKAGSLLLKTGFKEVRNELFGEPTAYATQTTFVKNIKPFGVAIDLHSEVSVGFTRVPAANKYFFSQEPLSDYLLKDSRRFRVDGSSFHIPSPESLLLVLLLHHFHHNFQKIRSLEAASKLLKTKKVSWQKFSILVKRFKLGGFVYPSSAFLKKYYDTNIPKNWLNKIQPDPVKRVASRLILYLTNPFNEDPRITAGVKRFLLLFVFSDRPLLHKMRALIDPRLMSFYFKAIKSFFLRSFIKSS